MTNLNNFQALLNFDPLYSLGHFEAPYFKMLNDASVVSASLMFGRVGESETHFCTQYPRLDHVVLRSKFHKCEECSDNLSY